jgi:BMFP domain-containing protein YqiC
VTEFNEMQSQNRFFDDISKVLNGLAGTVAGVGREAEASARERAKEWFGGMDFVSREEFEAVKEMAAKARAEEASRYVGKGLGRSGKKSDGQACRYPQTGGTQASSGDAEDAFSRKGRLIILFLIGC